MNGSHKLALENFNFSSLSWAKRLFNRNKQKTFTLRKGEKSANCEDWKWDRFLFSQEHLEPLFIILLPLRSISLIFLIIYFKEEKARKELVESVKEMIFRSLIFLSLFKDFQRFCLSV